jgi:hypothetical protein
MADHPVDNLDRALDLVEGFVATLNNERAPCPCCGLNVYQNLTDHKAFDELTGVINKLRRWGEQYRDPN